jgi:hypothetical protein
MLHDPHAILYENLSSKQHFYVEMVAGGSVLGRDIELGKNALKRSTPSHYNSYQ